MTSQSNSKVLVIPSALQLDFSISTPTVARNAIMGRATAGLVVADMPHVDAAIGEHQVRDFELSHRGLLPGRR
jgi:hypothetical protein